MLETFVHPYTKTILSKDFEGNLFCQEGSRLDLFKCYDGCYDFSVANPNVKEARNAYDELYARGNTPGLTLAAVTEPWLDETVPWRRTMLDNLGSLAGRQVLLLGNGKSYIEFYFLHLGARVVFTDLSLVAARLARDVFRRSEFFEKHRGQIEFHAVDAMHLPFPDQTFDIIYGTKFVGFLGNLEEFFLEVKRCLKPGGKCRFCDDAYSPAWEALKRTLVHPIKARRKSTSSLAKVRSDSTFGFKEESLVPFVAQCGFCRLVFLPEHFFLRVAQLCWATLLGWDPKRERYARPLFLAMKWIDNRLAKKMWMQRNRLALTWGFDK
ncbi:MAG: class I SAM-dependent methyltransferase [Verrucomicrobiota bacterium]|jgi:SAM-dependent methyltransferase